MKVKPDIRAITRLVPPGGNLVQGQSELPIDPQLALEAAKIIAASQNHYGGSEGNENLRRAVTAKIARYNGIEVDVDAREDVFDRLLHKGVFFAFLGDVVIAGDLANIVAGQFAAGIPGD